MKHIRIVIVFVLFGAGKLPKVMSELGRGIKSLRKGMNSENEKETDAKED